MAQQTDHDSSIQAPGDGLKPAAVPVELKPSDLSATAPVTPAELLQFAASGDSSQLLGQERALDAIRLATGIDAPGYNVFVTGVRSRAERDSILRLLETKAATMPTPGDWVYVNNFRSPEAPAAIYLQPGQGVQLRDRMRELVDYVVDQLPKAFRREDFDHERSALRDKYNTRAQELHSKFETLARERGFAVQSTPTGQPLFIPLFDGKLPESPEELSRKMNEMPEAQ